MYCAAAPASTTTRYSAACTTFCDRTTPIAATAIATARIQKTTFCADHRRHYFLPLTSAPTSSGSGSGTVSIHSPSLLLVVQQLGDAGLGVLVLGAPEQRVERADLDADPAVHAERVVDVEAVEHADACASRPPSRRGGALLLVALDVDAPVGALRGRTACRPCSSPP